MWVPSSEEEILNTWTDGRAPQLPHNKQGRQPCRAAPRRVTFTSCHPGANRSLAAPPGQGASPGTGRGGFAGCSVAL